MAIGPWGVVGADNLDQMGGYPEPAPPMAPPEPQEPNWQDPRAPVRAPLDTPATGGAPGTGGGVPDFGLSGIRKSLIREGQTQAVPDELRGEIDETYGRRVERAHDLGKEISTVQGQLAGLAATQETLIKTQNQALASAQEKLSKVAKRAQYPGMSLEDIERQESIANDASGRYSIEQKRAAQLALKRASEIDPTRLMSQSASNKVLAVIAQALGAAGTSMSGGRNPNFGMQLVENAIERDIMAQKAAFDSADRAYQRERTLYADLRANFESETQAMAAQRSMLFQSAEIMARKYGAEDQADQFASRALEERAKVEQEEKQRRVDALAKAGSVAAQQQDAALKNKQLNILSQRQAQKGQALIPGGARVMEGKSAILDTAQRRNEATKIMMGYNEVMPLLDDMIAARGKFGPEFLNRWNVADVESLYGALFNAMRQLEGTGAALSANEQANIEKQISANPNNIGFIMARLLATRRNIRTKVTGRLKTFNLELDDTDEGDFSLEAPTPGQR
jgi:hypothetical protein